MRNVKRRVPKDAVELSCSVVSAYVAANAVPPGRLPDLIVKVHAAFLNQCGEFSLPVSKPKTSLTATQIQASLGPGGILSFESGKRYASLRRHLGSIGLNPDAYRRKWGLPPDYPMVCPAYSARRSDIAKSIGLGRPQATST